MKYLLAVALLSLHLLGRAQVPANAESSRSQDGFAGIVLVTTDENWKQKWDTPSAVTPGFTKASIVPYGKNLSVLTFFSNPQPDAAGKVALRCDFKLLAPDGKVTLEQADMNCYTGRIAGALSNIYLAAPVINFAADASDPAGNWVVEVVLRDVVRGVALPLRTKFTLQ
ncbi:MAG: hypothetical protein ACEQSK_06790 [Sphingomonadaceae bacterium]